MLDINLLRVKEIARKANKTKDFGEERYPYLADYELFNSKIIEAAEEGKSSITLDFVVGKDGIDKSKSLKEIECTESRIYLHRQGGQASYDLYNYPSYLVCRGFNVEVGEESPESRHNYTTKTYVVSW